MARSACRIRSSTNGPDRCGGNRLDRGARIAHGKAPAFLALGLEIDDDDLAAGSVQLVGLIAANDGTAMPPPGGFGAGAQAELTAQGDADLNRVMYVGAGVRGTPDVEHASDTDEHATRPDAPGSFTQAGASLHPPALTDQRLPHLYR
jgi:hypothetical protein